MASRIEAYVDSSALIALLDKSDYHHLSFKRLFSAPPTLVTSALVISEAHGWFLRRYDRQRAIQFLNFIEELPISIEGFDEASLVSAGTLLRKFADQKLTLADAHGLVIMRQRSVRSCWSTDRHLGLTGVGLVI